MTADELRAMTSQGPAVIMVERNDMLKLLDENERCRRQQRGTYWLGISVVGAISLWLWQAIYSLLQWFGVF